MYLIPIDIVQSISDQFNFYLTTQYHKLVHGSVLEL